MVSTAGIISTQLMSTIARMDYKLMYMLHLKQAQINTGTSICARESRILTHI